VFLILIVMDIDNIVLAFCILALVFLHSSLAKRIKKLEKQNALKPSQNIQLIPKPRRVVTLPEEEDNELFIHPRDIFKPTVSLYGKPQRRPGYPRNMLRRRVFASQRTAV
jgi:hypothetical protein